MEKYCLKAFRVTKTIPVPLDIGIVTTVLPVLARSICVFEYQIQACFVYVRGGHESGPQSLD